MKAFRWSWTLKQIPVILEGKVAPYSSREYIKYKYPASLNHTMIIYDDRFFLIPVGGEFVVFVS